MLIGVYFCKVGKDGKIIIPLKLREKIENEIFIFETKNCLYLYSNEEKFKKFLEKTKNNDQKRAFLASIVERKIDKQGKLKISDFKNFYLEEDKKIVIVEKNDYLQIWSEEKWIKQVLEKEEGRKEEYSLP
ncbi:MAG TPA: hypothetical protein PLY02_01305 [Candidatus Pacearchaeota archaeon]|nr:hypothetical protein [Candidatus Pacearchaeota archaeon]